MDVPRSLNIVSFLYILCKL